MALLKTLHKSTITHQSQSAEILAALEAHPAFRAASTILLYHSLPRIPSAYKAGICFPFQIVEEVPAETFDIRMDEVITCE